jgi:peroxiredoxin
LSEQSGPGIGDAAPDFTLDADDGTQVRLSDYHGRHPVLLYFMREFT